MKRVSAFAAVVALLAAAALAASGGALGAAPPTSYCADGGSTIATDVPFEVEFLDEAVDAGGVYERKTGGEELSPSGEDGTLLEKLRDPDHQVVFFVLGSTAGWTFHTVAPGACPAVAESAGAPAPQGPDRYIFCAVAGNTWPDGTAIAPGTSLNLPADQAASDPHYQGATIGFWVVGVGATCSVTPGQVSIASASTRRVNHVGATGDPNEPDVYTLVG